MVTGGYYCGPGTRLHAPVPVSGILMFFKEWKRRTPFYSYKRWLSGPEVIGDELWPVLLQGSEAYFGRAPMDHLRVIQSNA